MHGVDGIVFGDRERFECIKAAAVDTIRLVYDWYVAVRVTETSGGRFFWRASLAALSELLRDSRIAAGFRRVSKDACA